MKTKSPKLSKEALIKIWQASRPNVYKNKKKYTRKNKYDNKICSQRLLNVYEDLINETNNSKDWVQD
jgi:hypothetical protein